MTCLKQAFQTDIRCGGSKQTSFTKTQDPRRLGLGHRLLRRQHHGDRRPCRRGPGLRMFLVELDLTIVVTLFLRIHRCSAWEVSSDYPCVVTVCERKNTKRTYNDE